MLQDLRLALRVLRVRPGCTAVLVLSLGVSIATNTTLFAIVNTIVFRPLPYETSDHGALSGVSPANFDNWRNHNQSVQSSAATVRSGFILTGRDDTRASSAFASAPPTSMCSEFMPGSAGRSWRKLTLSNERYTAIGVMLR